VADSPRQPVSAKGGALCGGWLVNRLVCAVQGHRQLATTAAATKLLPTGVRQELFLCHACGSYAWKATSKDFRFSWNEVSV
jgi:hypothetical protein